MHHSEAAPALSSPCTIGCLWPRDRRVIFPGLRAEHWGPGSSQSLSALSGPAGVGPGEKMMGPAPCHWLDLGTPVPTPSLSYGSSPPPLGCRASVVSRAASLLSRYTLGQEPPPIPRCVWALLSWQSLPGLQQKDGVLCYTALSPCLSFLTCTVGLWTRLMVPGLLCPFPLVFVPKQLHLSGVIRMSSGVTWGEARPLSVMVWPAGPCREEGSDFCHPAGPYCPGTE